MPRSFALFLPRFWARSFALLFHLVFGPALFALLLGFVIWPALLPSFCLVFRPALLPSFFTLFLGPLFLPSFWASLFGPLFCPLFASFLGPLFCPPFLLRCWTRSFALFFFFFSRSLIRFCYKPSFLFCLLRFGLSFGYPKRPFQRVGRKEAVRTDP